VPCIAQEETDEVQEDAEVGSDETEVVGTVGILSVLETALELTLGIDPTRLEFVVLEIWDTATSGTPHPLTLSWENYTVVSSPPVGSGAFAAETKWLFKCPATAAFQVTPDGDSVTVVGAFAEVDIVVVFQDTSWVVDGAQTPSLLLHEQLHLMLAEACAFFAAESIRGFEFTVQKSGPNAEADAKAEVLAALLAEKNAGLNAAQSLSGAITDDYDGETDHGRISEKQDEWEINWWDKLYVRVMAAGL